MMIAPSIEELKTAPRSDLGLNVMVVDDDPLVLLAVSSMLRRLGCKTVTAANGQMAVDEIKRLNGAGNAAAIGLMFMDANMPVMNGYEAATLISQMGKEGKVVAPRIACLSAQDSEEHAELCRASGMDYIGILEENNESGSGEAVLVALAAGCAATLQADRVGENIMLLSLIVDSHSINRGVVAA
ncbi:MAG: response regulator [Candidatus Pacebacteria bacterium]|nr:response regulator [Candidatus Paceibacterota bacterium]